MDFLGDSNNPSALDVVAFVRLVFLLRCCHSHKTKLVYHRSEVVEKFPHLRSNVTSRLIEKMNEIKSGKVFRGVMWILGEYIETVPDIQAAMQEIRKVLGEIPILASEQKLLDDVAAGEEEPTSPKVEIGGGKPKVLADGTYATETAYSSTTTARLEAVRAASKPPLRSGFIIIVLFALWNSRCFSALIRGGDFFTGTVLASTRYSHSINEVNDKFA